MKQHNKHWEYFYCIFVELSAKVEELTKERDDALNQLEEDDTESEGMSQGTGSDKEDDNAVLVAKLQKDLSAKDRMIESLEEQLRSNTQTEIKKLRRGIASTFVLKAQPLYDSGLHIDLHLLRKCRYMCTSTFTSKWKAFVEYMAKLHVTSCVKEILVRSIQITVDNKCALQN